MRKIERYTGLIERNIAGMVRRIKDASTLASYVKQANTLKKNVGSENWANVKKQLSRMSPALKSELRYTIAAIERHLEIDPEASIEKFKSAA